jgi:uncharacterized protein YecT (DUF1311 family)
MRFWASLVFCLVWAVAAHAEAPLTVEDCGVPLSAMIDDEDNFANIGADAAKFRSVSAPKFLAGIGELCRGSAKHAALVASRVTNIVFRPAPGGEQDVTVYLLGKTLNIEFVDPVYHAAGFRKALATGLENGSVAKASFDCAKAATPAETLICSDGELASADQDLGEAYKAAAARAKADPAKLAALRAVQKDWVAGRDRDCLAGQAPTALDPDRPESKPVIACLTTATSARAKALQ